MFIKHAHACTDVHAHTHTQDKVYFNESFSSAICCIWYGLVTFYIYALITGARSIICYV